MARFQHTVAVRFQNPADKHENCCLVLYHQDGFRTLAGNCLGHRLFNLFKGFLYPRQINLKGRATTQLAVNANVPCGLLDDAEDSRKAESSSLAEPFRRKKGVEDAGLSLRVHS